MNFETILVVIVLTTIFALDTYLTNRAWKQMGDRWERLLSKALSPEWIRAQLRDEAYRLAKEAMLEAAEEVERRKQEVPRE